MYPGNSLQVIDDLSSGERFGLARRIRSELRPRLFRRISALIPPDPEKAGFNLDLAEAEFFLRELDVYSSELDRLNAAVFSPPPSQSMDVIFHDEVRSHDQVSARTELYFSPTTRWIVHGPDVLRFAMALCERILDQGESLMAVDLAHWRRVVTVNLRLTVRLMTDQETPFEISALERAACVCGVLRTSRGRKFGYFGTLLPDYPITEESGHNTCATAMVGTPLALESHKVTGHALRLSPGNPWIERLNESPAFGLYCLAEIIGLFCGMQAPGNPATHLSVKVTGLTVPPGLGDLAVHGMRLDYSRDFNAARSRGKHLITVPLRYQFHPFQSAPQEGLMAITHLSVPELIAINEGRAAA